MNKRYDILESCLKELEKGATLDAILARYPDQAGELRPILKASMQARHRAVPDPSPEMMRRGRARLLQHAAELREDKKVSSRKRVIPAFQRLALSLSLTATFLLSGTGLVGASTSALPGENLYPVKRTWEDVRLLFVFNSDAHDALESHFENERLHEVSELLAEGRDAPIQIAGIYTLVSGTTYISGLPVLITSSTQLPAQGVEDGVPVSISGYTNANGMIEITSITLLPPGTYVPAGQPVEMESDSDADADSDTILNPISTPDINEESENAPDANSSGASPAGIPSDIRYFEAEGFVESFSNSSLILNGKTVYFDNVRISGDLKIGAKIDIKGYYASDGRFMVTQITVKKPHSDGDNGGDSNLKPKEEGSDNDNNHEENENNHESD